MSLDCGWLERVLAIRCGVARLESSGLCRKAQNRQRTPLGPRGAARGGEDCVLPLNYLLDPRRLSQAWKAGRSAPKDSDFVSPHPHQKRNPINHSNKHRHFCATNSGSIQTSANFFFTTRSILNHQHSSCSSFIFCYCADSEQRNTRSVLQNDFLLFFCLCIRPSIFEQR